MPKLSSPGSPSLAETLCDSVVGALLTADPTAKAAAAMALPDKFRASGELGVTRFPLPCRPARPEKPLLLPPAAMPRRRHGGSARGRFALFHALAHIELNAIDLALDIVARFGAQMPRRFTADWLQVAHEEARHFTLLSGLLADLGGHYGDLPAHDGLWEAAEKTAGSLAARLAIVPLVLEARGLDVTPAMIARLEAQQHEKAAQALQLIYKDEIGHVATGHYWFSRLCRESGETPVLTFRRLVQQYFSGRLKPPFNNSARLKAGLTPEWYS